MARLKRKSTAVDFAENRANALTSIDPALDLGNGLTLADYKTKTTALKTKNDTYNSDLSDLDASLNSIQADEKALDDLSARMLAGVGSKYGKDSSEYEQAGRAIMTDTSWDRPWASRWLSQSIYGSSIFSSYACASSYRMRMPCSVIEASAFLSWLHYARGTEFLIGRSPRFFAE